MSITLKNFVMKFQSGKVFLFGLLVAFISSVACTAGGASWWWFVPLTLGWAITFLHYASLKLRFNETFEELEGLVKILEEEIK